jgi:hypothetical protein
MLGKVGYLAYGDGLWDFGGRPFREMTQLTKIRLDPAYVSSNLECITGLPLLGDLEVNIKSLNDLRLEAPSLTRLKISGGDGYWVSPPYL